MRKREHWRSLRLKGYDYAQAGAYFITIATRDRACMFGDVVINTTIEATHALPLRNGASCADIVRLNEFGEIARCCWMEIPDHFPFVELDAFVIMPNHVHGIVVIDTMAEATPAGATHASRPPGPKPKSIAAIVGSYKSAVSRRVNALRGMAGVPVWQPNYYEHVVRDERGLNRIREYIQNNPARWAEDTENPERAMENSRRNGQSTYSVGG